MHQCTAAYTCTKEAPCTAAPTPACQPSPATKACSTCQTSSVVCCGRANAARAVNLLFLFVSVKAVKRASACPSSRGSKVINRSSIPGAPGRRGVCVGGLSLLLLLQAQCRGELQGRAWARLANCKSVVCPPRYKARTLWCSRPRGCNLKQCTSASPAARMASGWHHLQAGFRLSPRPRSADLHGWRLKPGSNAQLLTSSQVNAQVCTPSTAKAMTHTVSSAPTQPRQARLQAVPLYSLRHLALLARPVQHTAVSFRPPPPCSGPYARGLRTDITHRRTYKFNSQGVSGHV